MQDNFEDYLETCSANDLNFLLAMFRIMQARRKRKALQSVPQEWAFYPLWLLWIIWRAEQLYAFILSPYDRLLELAEAWLNARGISDP